MNGYGSYEYNETYDSILDLLEDLPREFWSIFLAIIIGVLILELAFLIVAYLFTSIGLYRMGKGRGMTNAYCAFIPFANMYYMGALADSIQAANGKQTTYRYKLLGFGITYEVLVLLYYIFDFMKSRGGLVSNELMAISTIVSLCYAAFMIVYMVFYFIALYAIYKEYKPNCAVAFLVLSILFSVVTPFFIFAIRNKVGTSQRPKVYYQYPPFYPPQYQ